MRTLASVVMYFYLVLACAGAERRNVHDNYVSPLNAHASKGFVIQQSNMVAELNTRPEDIKNNPFVPKTGKVINTERHNELLWAEQENSDTLFQVVSPVIPGNMSSQVICIGQFQIGGGGGDKKGQTQTTYTPWRSELRNTGVHIIVVHVYLNNIGDRTPESNTYNIPLENIRIASAHMLMTVYNSTGDRVVLVKCGYGDSNIKQIRELPDYLRSLKPTVNDESVRTYSTIGHGGWWTLGNKYTMKVLHSATEKDYEFVGDKEDFEFIYNAQNPPPTTPQPEQSLGLTIENYAAFLDPFLSQKALINLYHCYSGTDYNFPTRKEETSIAKQFKSSFDTLKKDVTVVGIDDLTSGRCWAQPVDENKNGSIDLQEIRAGPPLPETMGKSLWKFFTPVESISTQ